MAQDFIEKIQNHFKTNLLSKLGCLDLILVEKNLLKVI